MPSRSKVRARALAAFVALEMAAPPALAAPANDLAALYEEGVAAREAGDLTTAAERFAAAYARIRAEELERRAAVLFELVDAHLQAYAQNSRPYHLCRADEALAEFIEAATRSKSKGKSRDLRKASDLMALVRVDLDRARADRPGLDCATEPAIPPEPEPGGEGAPEGPGPAPEPPRSRLHDPLVASGAALTSAGSLLLGAMAMGLAIGKQADFEGEWLVKTHPDVATTTPQVVELDQIGRRTNTLALVGGVGGSVLLGVGVALLTLGVRRQRASAPAIGARADLRGLGVTWRF